MTQPTEPYDGPLFTDLGLPPPVLAAVLAVGYEIPSPIQAATIPHLLQGRDVLGQAQTGTGKTAAFVLPMLARMDVKDMRTQGLILAPTRELAIQVAEACQKYAAQIPGFHVMAIYGGQSYGPQLSALRRGVHLVVGTPGRVIDHLEKGSLKLDSLRTLVLDEADEMLRMGFIDDVEKILQTTPDSKQVALFSATMPPPIKRIAQTYLKNPSEVTIASKTRTATNVRQRYWLASGAHKLDALTRILETETFEGMIVFARTKIATEELADKLAARGFSVAALNGDIPQQQRERTVNRLKDGQLDIIVATDVAARGLDVERVTHVINYDVPTDTESYVHRIGRTGRAGRSGDAILFIAPRERGLLKMIERATRQPIEAMPLPSVEAVNTQRREKFKQRITDTLSAKGPQLDTLREMLSQIEHDHEVSMLDIAAACALLVQGDKPLFLQAGFGDAGESFSAPRKTSSDRPERNERPARFERERGERSERPARSYERSSERSSERPADRPRLPFAGSEAKPSYSERARTPFGAANTEAPKPTFNTERPSFKERSSERPAFKERAPFDGEAKPRRPKDDIERETFRIEVGHVHGVMPANIVGAIANEADMESRYIGRIDIREDHTHIDLPEGMPTEVFTRLQSVWVSGQKMRISRVNQGGERPTERKPFKPRK